MRNFLISCKSTYLYLCQLSGCYISFTPWKRHCLYLTVKLFLITQLSWFPPFQLQYEICCQMDFQSDCHNLRMCRHLDFYFHHDFTTNLLLNYWTIWIWNIWIWCKSGKMWWIFFPVPKWIHSIWDCYPNWILYFLCSHHHQLYLYWHKSRTSEEEDRENSE